ncbi:MAG TPA: ester cyclase [Thermoleophilaceae bacterium]
MSAPSDDLRARRTAVVQAHLDAENRHDPEGILATFEEPRYDVVMLENAADVSGTDAVRDMWEDLLSGFPDIHLEAGPLHHADDGVFVDVVMTGTNTGPWSGVQPTGLPVRVRMGCFFEFDGEVLVCEHMYMDLGTLLGQLGLVADADVGGTRSTAERIPDLTLPHVNGGDVPLSQYADRPFIMTFAGQGTSGQVEQIVEAIRSQRSSAELPIVQISPLKGVPRLVRGLARRDLRGAYSRQAEREAARRRASGQAVPDDLSDTVVILMDWENEAVALAGAEDLDHAAVAVLVDGKGTVVARGAGEDAAQQVMREIA